MSDPQRLAALHEEIRLSRQISHPHVCRVHDIAETDGQPFLSMEFIDGEDLASLLRRIGRLSPDKGLQIAQQLCLGLAAAHEKGVMHRDLKPANIMLDGRGQVRLTDFGLARLADHVTGTDARSGTPAYMAPEQLAGKEATVRSDIYALGLILYEVFTGKRAFRAASRAELARLHEQSSPSNPSSHVADLNPAVERVILRCLQKDPRHRPASALAVAAALPGGDPLAAALAAGETPSPEMVAAAGDSGVWSVRYAVACLVGTLIALVCCVLVYRKGTVVGRVGMPRSPEVLEERARDILKKLGFGPGTDSAIGFDYDGAYLRWIGEDDPAPWRWDRLEQPRQAALHFWYRQSPQYLIPNLYYPYQGTLEPGRITLDEPAPVVPGMVSVKLDLHGRLLGLHWVPRAADLAGGQGGEPPWKALFDAAELDLTQFRDTPSAHIPPSFAHERRAWEGKLPDSPDLLIRVEAAALHGRPVWFHIVGPWAKYGEESAGTQGALDRAGVVLSALLFAAVLGAAALLARPNWRLGRADRKGAFRLAVWSFAILMVVWLFETHHVPGIDELRLLTLGLAFALSWAGLLWLTYLALEPYVRRLWPECLITWTRLLAGQWRDPRVGRDVLLGVLGGVLMALLDTMGRVVPAWLETPAPAPYFDWWIPNTFIRGYWVGNFILNLAYSFRWAFFFDLLLLLVLRVVLRRPALAAAVYVVLAAALSIGTTASFEPSWYWPFAVLIEVLLVCLLVRVGILAAIMAVFTWYCVCFPLTPDLTSWYAQNSLLAVGAVVLLAGYGFHTSLGGRPLFADEALSK